MGRPAAATSATLTCPFGAAPATLMATATPTVLIEGKPAGTMKDTIPLGNIPSFGMCSSLANPTVASATAAALGVLTPMPCVPVPTTWANTATRTMIGGAPGLQVGSICPCAYGGVIQVTNPGTVRTMTG